MEKNVLRFKEVAPGASIISLEKPTNVHDMLGLKYIEADAEFFDWDDCSPLEVAFGCMDTDAIAKASKLCQESHSHGATCPPTEDCVYLIGNESGTACKIGKAKSPGKRLDTLQVGSWEPLQIHALFWSMETKAQAIEHASLWAAREAGLAIRGEWFKASPEELAMIIVEECRRVRTRISSSHMFIRHRQMVAQSLRYHGQGIPPEKGSGIILEKAA